MPPRRFQLLIAFVLFLVLSMVFYGPPSSADLPTMEEVKEAVKNPQNHLPELPEFPDLPKIPFGPSAHKPQSSPNSTTTSSYRTLGWFQDFKWKKNPFSSAITLDENTAVLPPLDNRPFIYTYYDPPSKQDKAITEAENRLILAWRRAWWAQGFRPQVLSLVDAKTHPQYQLVQRMKLDTKAEADIFRWLAWGSMGSGILANWLALPMAEYDNAMLSFLRRNEYPILSRIDTLQNGIFFGEVAAVNAAIKKVVDGPLLKNVTANKDKITELGKKEGGAVVNLLSKDDIAVDSKANGIAYYSIETISKSYKLVAEKLTNATQAEGLGLLASLINAHLRLTFQQTFPEGMAILKPLPEHTTSLLTEAIEIGRNLTQCPTSPIPKSCPPNKSSCTVCDSNKPPKLQLLSSYKKSAKLFTIGTVPHPYTLNTLHYTRNTIDENFLRRSAERDLWITAATKDILKEGSAGDRVLRFKQIVATPYAASTSLWLTAERESQVDLDWIFGFALPQRASPTDKPDSPSEDSSLIIFPRPAAPEPLNGVKEPEEKWVKKEEYRITKARDALKSKDQRMTKVVDMVEKWNLADTEAWKFARAWSARRRVERLKWEQEEKKYAGAENKVGTWSD
ncbi:hypothetical protein P154DRAFT_518825 [Amniculicola lignicola CBS 123094]|uniref:Uncharacterized protein n=1 Tax=Amniculicola lignicola CBS 123094 TaxID=1392246 RepID=A0A6A5WX41_9PLEO|nr:hypothetical protein P154DRAFT_518825 [Amniculicola lignicola CBS 123094]